MTDISSYLKKELLAQGADLVGFGDLSELPAQLRANLPVGICTAVKYPKEVIRGIAELPTREYFNWYNELNERLDKIVTHGAKVLQDAGHRALAKTREQVGYKEGDCETLLPHKTAATRAGLGWIGKCALLVTPEYGSMVRLSVILTDAPLDCARPVNASRCGSCTACVSACPGGAVLGANWSLGTPREAIFDPVKCLETALARTKQSFGEARSVCGKCIEICPYTRRYLNQED